MIVVDTNVVSELMRPTPSAIVVGWMRNNSGSHLCTTSTTLAEIRYGIERLPAGRRKDAFRIAADEIFAAFDEYVLPFDRDAALYYATIASDRERAGIHIDGFDAQIAAVCRAHDATLATRNVKEFQETGIDIVDPWREV